MSVKRVYEGKEPFVFISYSHKDTEKVIPIIEDLQEKGFRVWYDAGIEAGSEWPEYIAEHLFSCGCVIAFISESSVVSQNCKREINFAIDKNKPVLVVYLEEFELSLGMQMQLNTLQAIYYSGYSDENKFLEALAESKIIFSCKNEKLTVAEKTTAFSQNKSNTENETEADTGKELYLKAKESYDRHDYEKSFELFEQAAILGEAHAQYYLAESYLYGRGIEKSETTSIRWYKKSAMQSLAEAQNKLAYFCKHGLYVEKNIDEAITLYEKAALQGNVFSMQELAKLLFDEKKNFDKAFKWYKKCVETGGDALAMRALANCYFNGLGTEKNYNLAFQWYFKSEENYKNEVSEMMLAECYEKGLGTEKNYEEALCYYKAAAEKGNKAALKKIIGK